MNTIRKLVSVAATLGSVGVGVISARALDPTDEESVDANTAVVIDASAIEFAEDPAVTATSVTVEDTAVEASTGDGDASGIAALPTVDEDLLFVDDPIAGISVLPQRAYDSCAGSAAGVAPGAGCPVGFAGVLGGRTPPAPYIWGTAGRYLVAPRAPFPDACPGEAASTGADYNAITVFSRTPLDSLEVRYRPYREEAIDDEYVSFTVHQPTPFAERQAWMARFETEEYSRESFGYLTLCGILVERDPNLPYEVILEATDSFEQRVSSRAFVLPDRTPSGGRPPTQVEIDGDWVFISAWAPPTGAVTFHTRVDYPPNRDRACAFGSGSVEPGDATRFNRILTRDDQVFSSPYGVYDPTFTRKVTAWIPLPSEPLLLCTTVLAGDHATPIGIDTHLIQGATRKTPMVSFAFVGGDIPVREGELRVTVGSPDYECEPPRRPPEVASSGWWTCPTLPNDTRIEVPVVVEYYRYERWLRGGTTLVIETGAEGHFPSYTIRVGLPRRSGEVCFWTSCNQGYYLVEVFFPELGVPGGPTVVLIQSSDR